MKNWVRRQNRFARWAAIGTAASAVNPVVAIAVLVITVIGPMPWGDAPLPGSADTPRCLRRRVRQPCTPSPHPSRPCSFLQPDSSLVVWRGTGADQERRKKTPNRGDSATELFPMTPEQDRTSKGPTLTRLIPGALRWACLHLLQTAVLSHSPGRCLVYRSHTTPSPSPSRALGTIALGKPLPFPWLPKTRSSPAATASSQDLWTAAPDSS